MIVKARTPDPWNHPQKDAVVSWLNTNAETKDASFKAIREALHVSSEVLPDGALHQIAVDAGYLVESGPSDNTGSVEPSHGP